MSTNIDSHSESILLLSDNQRCFDRKLINIIEDIKSDILDYGDSISADPNVKRCEKVKMCKENSEIHKSMLWNSVWLINYKCVKSDIYETHLTYLIRNIPLESKVIICVKGSDKEDKQIKEDLYSKFSNKVTVVFSKKELKLELTTYLDQTVNPKRNPNYVADWKEKVQQKINEIG